MRHQMASDVLKVFRYYTAIKELVLWYNASNEAGVVPAQIQVDAVGVNAKSIRDAYTDFSSPRSTALRPSWINTIFSGQPPVLS
jgi:hypothetical protein